MCTRREWVTRDGVGIAQDFPRADVNGPRSRCFRAICGCSPGEQGTARTEEETDMTEKVWFITGTSRGFGREWTIAALERGDKVAATARDTATLDDLVAKY